MKLFLALTVTLWTSALPASTIDNWGLYPKRPLELRDFVPPDGRRFSIIHDFPYVDKSGRIWPAPADLIVDGASIPRPFWVLIGGPLEGLYREASVVHDVACCAQMQRWQDVHHMFYDAMRCSGVSWLKAKTMFFAVWIGGPRWSKLNSDIPAPCKLAPPAAAAATAATAATAPLNNPPGPDVFSKILKEIETRALTPAEAKAVARPFFTKGEMSDADATEFVTRLKRQRAESEMKDAIVESVIQSERFSDEDVRKIEGWIEKENPDLEMIERRAEEERRKKIAKLRLFPQIPELLELVNRSE